MAYRGKLLRAVREEQNIQLQRISDDTRIAKGYLNAIEEERFECFPGRFYFKSFANQYSRSIGLDPKEVLGDLQGAYDEWHRRKEEELEPKEDFSSGGLFVRFAGRILRPPEV